MRHLLANIAVYVLAVGLVVGSVLFAWIRSQQIVFATEAVVEPPAYVAADSPDVFEWEDFGERVYVANCQNCHGSAGTGRDVYPPVVGQGAMLKAEGGRSYLSRVVLYGLWSGLHSAPMPPMPHLSDAQIAAVNNFILTRFDTGVETDQLYVPRDVTAERTLGLSERDVGRQRPTSGVEGLRE